MDKITQYEKYITDFLREYSSEKPVNLPKVENQVIIDSTNHHYLLLRVGWNDKEFIHHCVFHFDIKDEKIWLQQNWTEVLVADILVEKGVPKSDIVLGFEPDFMRPYSGFAAA